MAVVLRQGKQRVDPRLDDGKVMERLLEQPDFKRYVELLCELRSEAMYMVLAVDVESVKNRERLRTVDDIIGLPEKIIRKAKIIQEES